MENQNSGKPTALMIRELCPTLTETELREAEANLRRYIQIAADVQKEQAKSGIGFDTSPDPTTMRERSNANLKS
jgi:hypothetical protein